MSAIAAEAKALWRADMAQRDADTKAREQKRLNELYFGLKRFAPSYSDPECPVLREDIMTNAEGELSDRLFNDERFLDAVLSYKWSDVVDVIEGHVERIAKSRFPKPLYLAGDE